MTRTHVSAYPEHVTGSPTPDAQTSNPTGVDKAAQVAAAPLTAVDRCDACSARAAFRVCLSSGDLLFCAHHARSHGPALKAQALTIHDATGTAVSALPGC